MIRDSLTLCDSFGKQALEWKQIIRFFTWWAWLFIEIRSTTSGHELYFRSNTSIICQLEQCETSVSYMSLQVSPKSLAFSDTCYLLGCDFAATWTTTRLGVKSRPSFPNYPLFVTCKFILQLLRSHFCCSTILLVIIPAECCWLVFKDMLNNVSQAFG
jgi:hypothetical protein